MRKTGESKFKQHFILTIQLNVIIITLSIENSLYQTTFTQQFTLHLRNRKLSEYRKSAILMEGEKGKGDLWEKNNN